MTPHKHAEVIHAYADGSAVQYRDDDSGEWEDCRDPYFFEDNQYRIKPSPVMAWYRVAMIGNITTTADSEEEEAEAESFDNFIRWLTDRVEYEVTP